MLYADFAGETGCLLRLLAVRPESQLVLLGELLAGPRRNDPRVVKVRWKEGWKAWGVGRGGRSIKHR